MSTPPNNNETTPEDAQDVTANSVNAYPDGEWDELVDAMHDYLGALQEQATIRKEEALEEMEKTEEKFAEFEKKRKKRYTYGTRTGIITKGQTANGDDSDDS